MKNLPILLLCLIATGCTTLTTDTASTQTNNNASIKAPIKLTPLPKAEPCDVDEMPAIIACTHAAPIPNGATFGTVVDALLTDRKTIEGCRAQLDKLRENIEICNALTDEHNNEIEQANQHILQLNSSSTQINQTQEAPAWWMFWR